MTSSMVSSSPVSIRGGSPTRRRSNSPDELTDFDLANRPRHSPTLVRSFDPNDPQVRERQRTMDVDMAMQLSRARRETLHTHSEIISSPTAIPGPQSPYHSPEDHEHHHHDHHHDIEHDEDAFRDNDAQTIHVDVARQSSLHRKPHLHQTHDPALLATTTNAHLHLNIHDDDPSASSFGLPTYQANITRSSFDFARMEEFAAGEKAALGISSPVNTKFNLDLLRRRTVTSPLAGNDPSISTPDAAAPNTTESHPTEDPTAAPVASGSSPVIGESTRPLRHRKLSQSNPNPRSHRKGIGGKMALFENDNSSALPARLNFLSPRSGLSAGPSFEPVYDTNLGINTNVPSYSIANTGLTPGGGILATGHDRPYRFSFYSNALSATIHARSLSELPAEGQTFEDLFSGRPWKGQSGDAAWGKGVAPSTPPAMGLYPGPPGDLPKDRPSSAFAFNPPALERPLGDGYFNGMNTPRRDIKGGNGAVTGGMGVNGAPGIHGEDNTWWLDVTSPTDEEMKMLSKVFSIHPLTTEDILMEETREKIELFRNYYLVCFRSFDQDPYSPTHLEPLNMYIIVFREGTLSFHFRPTPHPQNVRRRIKQLKDYISVTSDWISYALIDDITDAFGPLIQSIEYEVDSIDELVLILKEAEQSDMLRRIGTCRKKVMGLLRLMGNKADVVKGLAKRCNENWRVAPTSDIGLYLSDIQDHLITMTQNLNHYEKILSRSHSNYLAQISIEMTDANNQINDVLSKLTALGTILIPMNLVTGLWGMNVHVPGQVGDGPEGFTWFVCIIAGLAAFALIGGYSAYRLMLRK